MIGDAPDAWQSFAETVQSMASSVDSITATLARMVERDEREHRQLWEAIAEVRDGLVDLDHAKAAVRRVDELHSRIDEHGADLRALELRQDELQVDVSAIDNDLTTLRNDYRGEAA